MTSIVASMRYLAREERRSTPTQHHTKAPTNSKLSSSSSSSYSSVGVGFVVVHFGTGIALRWLLSSWRIGTRVTLQSALESAGAGAGAAAAAAAAERRFWVGVGGCRLGVVSVSDNSRLSTDGK